MIQSFQIGKLSLLFFLLMSTFVFTQNTTENIANYQISEVKKLSKKSRPKFPKSDLYFEFDFNKKSETLKTNEDHYMAKIIATVKKEFRLQDGSLTIVQEAKDSLNNWKPIEKWLFSWCGNSYDNYVLLKPNQYVEFAVKKYSGNYKTEVRLKMRNNNETYYSASFPANIDYDLFSKAIIEKEYKGRYSNLDESNIAEKKTTANIVFAKKQVEG